PGNKKYHNFTSGLTIRSIEIAIAVPTPKDNVKRIIEIGIDPPDTSSICSPSTCTAGSTKTIINPKRNPMKTRSFVFFAAISIPKIRPISMNPEFTAVKNKIKPNKVKPRPINIFLISSLSSLTCTAIKTKNTTAVGIRAVMESNMTCGNVDKMRPKMPLEKTYSSATPWIFLCPDNIDINMTAKIGPALTIPTNPKEFSSASFPPLKADKPLDRARTKGVVSAPVVAPEASNEIARNSSETKKPNRSEEHTSELQ